MRSILQKYPDFSAEIEQIERTGITNELINRIVDKHQHNARFNEELIARYEAIDGGVPIFDRIPRFAEGDDSINNKINNDFFSEIVDFKTGYFAGNPISYSYGNTREALEETGEGGDSEAEQKEARDVAAKIVTDFIYRSNMFDVDMECTKYASICGYGARLFYINTDGDESVMVVPPNEAAILSKTRDVTHPTYGLRYYKVKDINDVERVKAEFYDDSLIYYAEGYMGALSIVRTEPNLFGCCPLQGIPNNREMQGDAEKVLSLIDAYDRALSDTNNEVESFANAYMVFKNINISEEEMHKARGSGAIQFYSGGGIDGDVYFLTKNINDNFIEHHLERLKENIYQFSKTPNLSDDTFGTASGISLKFKLTGLETKCGMFEAKMLSAGTYMFQLLSKVWEKKMVKIDPMQCTMTFKRNFPLDIVSEAQAVQALIASGVPDRIAYETALSCVDDIEYLMQEKERQKQLMIPALEEMMQGGMEEETDEME